MKFKGLGFGVWGLGLGIWGMRFGGWGLGSSHSKTSSWLSARNRDTECFGTARERAGDGQKYGAGESVSERVREREGERARDIEGESETGRERAPPSRRKCHFQTENGVFWNALQGYLPQKKQ